MRIGIDIRPLMSPIRAGVGIYTHELLNALFTIDTKNQYFLFYNSYTDVSRYIPQWKQQNITYIQTRWPNKIFNAAIKIAGIPHIPAHQLDYFFSPNLNFTSLHKNTKSVLTIHDLSFEFFPHFFSTKQRAWHWAVNPKKQCQNAHAIITPSENTKQDIVATYGIAPKKIHVIYPGIVKNTITKNFDYIKKKYNLPDAFILFLGTIEPRKNIIGLIKAFTAIASQIPSYSLVIAGYPGWKDVEIFQAIHSSPFKHRILRINSVAEEDKYGLYSLSNLFVYPSFYEGFGFPAIEAMACGTPVITSNRSSLPEITNNTAILIDPNRPGEIADAIMRVLLSDSVKQHLVQQGIQRAAEFSWLQTAQHFLSLLHTL